MADETVLPLLAPDDLDGEQRALYDRIASGPRAAANAAVPVTDEAGRLTGPFNTLLYAPNVGDAVQELGARIRYGLSLSDRERELATLLVAGRAGSSYELAAHARLAATAGIDEAAIEALRTGTRPDLADERERRVLTLCEVLLAPAPDPAEVAAAADGLGPDVVAELTILVGYYQLLARLLSVAGVTG
jgi:4-carboxymuconolactone decarboxylase